jgi:hypothetical protein
LDFTGGIIDHLVNRPQTTEHQTTTNGKSYNNVAANTSQRIFENGVADGRKPSGPGRARYTGGLAPYRYGNLKML